MAKSKEILMRFTVPAGGEEHVILTARRNPNNGDIYLTSRSGNKYRDPGKHGPHPANIQEVHITVHPSRESDENINVINSRITRTVGGPIRTRFHTGAIKSGETFSYIMARRCSDVRSPRYSLPEDPVLSALWIVTTPTISVSYSAYSSGNRERNSSPCLADLTSLSAR